MDRFLSSQLELQGRGKHKKFRVREFDGIGLKMLIAFTHHSCGNRQRCPNGGNSRFPS